MHAHISYIYIYIYLHYIHRCVYIYTYTCTKTLVCTWSAITLADSVASPWDNMSKHVSRRAFTLGTFVKFLKVLKDFAMGQSSFAAKLRHGSGITAGLQRR